MKTTLQRKHSMDTLFMILLFSFFVTFLLLLLLFSSKAYQASADGSRENNELRTAMSYITTKVHQHDASDAVFYGEVEGLPALCLRDKIEERDFITYIFLDGDELKELFTSSENSPVRMLGTPFCEMNLFDIELLDHGLYKISLTDTSGHSGDIFFHPGMAEGGIS